MASQRIRRSAALVAAVIVFWCALMLAAGHASDAVGTGDRYNVPLWIAGNLSRLWLNPIARHLGGGFAPATDTEVVQFISGSSAVAAAERDVAYSAAAGNTDLAAAEDELAQR